MIRGIISILCLMFVFTTLMVGQVIYNEDIKENRTTDIYNTTANINVDFDCEELYNNTYEKNLPDLRINRINNIMCSFARFAVTAGLETTKFGVEFGYENPQYDYDFIFKVVRLYIWALIAMVVLPLLIPLIALIYLACVGIKALFNRKKKVSQTTEKEKEE